MEEVILVNENDKVIGSGEKLKTHLEGRLHRAFSVFVFNSAGSLLLQKRARAKYHSGSLWSNTCCSHPRPGETTESAAHRRLMEEMGFDCELREAFSFTYKAQVDNGFFEHEYDHVFTGRFDDQPLPSSEEVEDWKWIALETLKRELEINPADYTCWLNVSFHKLLREGSMLQDSLAGSAEGGHLAV